jgi:hypothetical protein
VCLREPRNGGIDLIEVNFTDCVFAQFLALSVVLYSLGSSRCVRAFWLVWRKLDGFSGWPTVLLEERHRFLDEVRSSQRIVEVYFGLTVLYMLFRLAHVHEVVHVATSAT